MAGNSGGALGTGTVLGDACAVTGKLGYYTVSDCSICTSLGITR